MNKNQRALELREQGLTLQQIGNELGATREGARRMVLKGLEERAIMHSEFAGLSRRTANALSKAGLSLEDVIHTMKTSRHKRYVIKNIGDKAIEEIIEWLMKKGVIL